MDCEICGRDISNGDYHSTENGNHVCLSCYVALLSGLVEQIYKEGYDACLKCESLDDSNAGWKTSKYAEMLK